MFPHRQRNLKKDHPRRCGENFFRFPLFCPTAGSPPQVRGKLFVRALPDTLLRITPAGAGKTLHGRRGHCTRRDHPRRCGENSATPSASPETQGSPPQVRGKLLFSNIDFLRQRITPAGAGKTVLSSVACLQGKDHPRRCGENLGTRWWILSLLGSPPQVRGKQQRTEE